MRLCFKQVLVLWLLCIFHTISSFTILFRISAMISEYVFLRTSNFTAHSRTMYAICHCL